MANDNLVLSLDMLSVESGEILTAYGNYEGDIVRARLSFYPSGRSGRYVQNRALQKVTYETAYTISGLEKVLDLPGEQHFLVPRSQVIEFYKPRMAFPVRSARHSEAARAFIKYLVDACEVGEDLHGLAGSGALHCLLPESDMDWIVYTPYSSEVRKAVSSSDMCVPDLSFSIEHALRKYRVFSGFSEEQLKALFVDRWKYFRFRSISFSLSFVDPKPRADGFLQMDTCGVQQTVRGRVTRCGGSYHIPRVIPVETVDGHMCILTWLFLYNGAFRENDEVEIRGTLVDTRNELYVLVEQPSDYIRNISAERRYGRA